MYLDQSKSVKFVIDSFWNSFTCIFLTSFNAGLITAILWCTFFLGDVCNIMMSTLISGENKS